MLIGILVELLGIMNWVETVRCADWNIELKKYFIPTVIPLISTLR